MALRNLRALLFRLCHYSNIAKGELTSSPLKSGRISQFLSFLRCSSFPRKRESSSRKAGLFTSACFRLKSLFCFTLLRVRNWSRVAGRACYFAAGLSRLKNCFRFTMSRVRQISRVAGGACYFAAGLSRLKNCFCFTLSRVRQISRVAGGACYFAADLSRLKSCFCFTLSRVRQISRVEITGSAGFGLVEVLFVSGLGLTVTMGSLKTAQLTFQSSNMVKTTLQEKDFKEELSALLNNPSYCKALLKPSNLADSSGKKGFLTSMGRLTDLENSFIDIQKAELKEDRNFFVYYKKPLLGEFQTIGNGACSSTDTTGCYFFSCKMDYQCAGNECSGDDDKCAPLNCSGYIETTEAVGANIPDCPEGTYLTGISDEGQPECGTLSCPEGRVLSGTQVNTEDNTITPLCLEVSECEEGEIYQGVDSEGVKQCAPVASAQSQVCPPGQYLFNSGQMGDPLVCQPLCQGGGIWNGTSCVCPADQSWTGYRCACTRGRTWQGDRCACPNDKFWDAPYNACHCKYGIRHRRPGGMSICHKSCPAHRHHYLSHLGRCVICSNRGGVVVGADCVCGNGKTWNAGRRRCSCPYGYGDRGGGCVAISCQNSQTVYNDSVKRCVPACQSHQFYDGTNCVAPPCSDREQWNRRYRQCLCLPEFQTRNSLTGRCECLAGREWNGSTCACPSLTPKWNSNRRRCEACLSATPKWNSSTNSCEACQSATPKWNGSSCVTCVAYNSATPKWNSSTNSCEACPSGQAWSGSQCVAYSSSSSSSSSSSGGGNGDGDGGWQPGVDNADDDFGGGGDSSSSGDPGSDAGGAGDYL